MTRISTQLHDLHDGYVSAVNEALTQGDERRAQELADEFDVEVLETVRRQLAAA